MKAIHIALSGALALGTLAATASPHTLLSPLARPASLAAAATQAEGYVLLTEDFSKMSAGSESTPDGTYIADKRTGAIPSNYTSIPGWSGAAVYRPAGHAPSSKANSPTAWEE